MRMDDLIRDLPIDGPSLSVDVRGITHDSRRVAPGDLYVALVGERFDQRMLNSSFRQFRHSPHLCGKSSNKIGDVSRCDFLP